LLILRNAAFAGMSRFTDFQRSLDIAPNVLAARLERFVEDGLMRISSSKGYPEYHLTDKGLDFKAVIIALTQWGDRCAAPRGQPIAYADARCGGRVQCHLECESCQGTPRTRDVVAHKTAVMAKLQSRRRGRSSRAGTGR